MQRCTAKNGISRAGRVHSHDAHRARRLGAGAGLAVLGALAAGVAGATDYPTSDYLTGNWGGLRDRWQQAGFEFFLNYTTEPMWNVAGGEKRGGTYLDNIGADFLFDLERIVGLPGTHFLVRLSQRDGDSVSADYIAPSEGGNLFPVQQIYGGQTFKVVNVQFNTRLLDDRLDFAYGRIVANDDFLRSDLYCQFLNNAICGSPKAVFFEDPFAFSAYPSAQWGARARFDTGDDRWTVQAAVYDADINLQHGDPSAKPHNKHGDSWAFGNNGVVLAGELQYHLNPNADRALPGIYKLGGYWMNGDYRNISQTDGSTVQGNAMLWLLADQMLYREAPGGDEGLWGFGAWINSREDRVNLLDDQLSLGLVYRGLLPSRPRDSLGFAFTRGWVSNEQNVARLAQGLPTQHAESVYELNYKFVLGRGITFEPDVQYIQDPAATGEINDAWAVGAQITLDL
ncbi:MAG: carbohydrate porin [Thiohalocapsa sp.]|uniref:carbohydrate porin n=1 Tax=Thiohalocapsa sp. TaxID=2497641 RepID=UPI0025E5D7B8|nr:carbohydrate porin [Thiohalocapsa sp.]MCG6941850.1 carbohydrate porin [Thiohalocapsa sp.]